MSLLIAEVHVGDFGGRVEITFIDKAGAVIDISDATVAKEVRFHNPSDVLAVKPANFVTDGTDGKIDYVVEDGLFDVNGRWKIQGRVEGANFENSTRRVVLPVKPNLA